MASDGVLDMDQQDVDQQAALDVDNNNPQAAWQAVDGDVNVHRNPLVAWRVRRAGHDHTRQDQTRALELEHMAPWQQ